MKINKLKLEWAFKLCTPLLFLFSISAFSQTQWISQGSGYTYSFDLKYGSVATSDSSEIIDIGMQLGDILEVFVDSSSNSPIDSIGIYTGARGWAAGSRMGITAPNDTIWGGLAQIRDSSWTAGNVLIANSVGTHYTLYEPVLDLAKFQILNARSNLPDRQIKLILKIKKSLVTQ